jgi:hypothetical protein
MHSFSCAFFFFFLFFFSSVRAHAVVLALHTSAWLVDNFSTSPLRVYRAGVLLSARRSNARLYALCIVFSFFSYLFICCGLCSIYIFFHICLPFHAQQAISSWCKYALSSRRKWQRGGMFFRSSTLLCSHLGWTRSGMCALTARCS